MWLCWQGCTLKHDLYTHCSCCSFLPPISKMICSTYFKKNQIQVGLSKYFEVEESLLLDWTLSLSCLFDREVDEMFKNAEAFIHYPRCQLKMGTETTPRRSWRKYLERCLRLVDFEVSPHPHTTYLLLISILHTVYFFFQLIQFEVYLSFQLN